MRGGSSTSRRSCIRKSLNPFDTSQILIGSQFEWLGAQLFERACQAVSVVAVPPGAASACLFILFYNYYFFMKFSVVWGWRGSDLQWALPCLDSLCTDVQNIRKQSVCAHSKDWFVARKSLQ